MSPEDAKHFVEGVFFMGALGIITPRGPWIVLFVLAGYRLIKAA